MLRADSCWGRRDEWREVCELRWRVEPVPSEALAARCRGFGRWGRAVVKETAKVRELRDICSDQPAL